MYSNNREFNNTANELSKLKARFTTTPASSVDILGARIEVNDYELRKVMIGLVKKGNTIESFLGHSVLRLVYCETASCASTILDITFSPEADGYDPKDALGIVKAFLGFFDSTIKSFTTQDFSHNMKSQGREILWYEIDNKHYQNEQFQKTLIRFYRNGAGRWYHAHNSCSHIIRRILRASKINIGGSQTSIFAYTPYDLVTNFEAWKSTKKVE